MTGALYPDWPARKLGLGVFVMMVNATPVLLYVGRTRRDIERYIRHEAGRTVIKFGGDVLYRCEGDADMWLCEASTDLASRWTTAFLSAVSAGKAELIDPTAFAVMPSAGDHDI